MGLGSNVNGQLGNGSTTGFSIPNSPEVIMSNVVAVSAGEEFTMAVNADNYLYAWGANWAGQLGDGSVIDRHNPVRIMANVLSVSAGHSHTLALNVDRILLAWGNNRFGQIGDGTRSHRTNDSTYHTPIRIMDNIMMLE